MSIPRRLPVIAITMFVFLLPTTLCTAQVSPEQAIRKILETIDEELGEIDRLLDQTRDQRPSGGEGKSSSESVQKYRELLGETEGSQKRVVRGIEDLIEQLQSMQNQSSSSSSQDGEQNEPQQGQQRSQDPLQDQQNGERRDSGRPESTEGLREDGKQPGEQKQPSSDGEKPQDPGQDPQTGQNRPAGAPTEDGEERVLREGDQARWGNLQRYDLHKHIRGGLPQVPEKYRRFLEAYQRTNQRTRDRR